ncbi:hypothetical protein V9K97_01470 [Variovorax sp. CCNWLW186]|uniref:hypothetical protein n=1 Tax=Variovorax sp. CCNWLW186 TaxID=3127473 RepID=UPI003077A7ED
MTEDSIEKYVLLLLGWLLGLLSPVIVDGIKRRRDNKMGRAAIRVELRQLRERLVMAAYGVEDHLGTQTKEKIRWALEHLSNREDDKIRSAMEMRLNLSDEQFAAVASHLAGEGNQSIRLQNYATPLLDARVSALWSFGTEAQRTLLELKTAMGFLEDAVDQSRYFNELTFKDLPSVNYDIAVKSVDEYFALYAKRARRAVELIDKFNGQR